MATMLSTSRSWSSPSSGLRTGGLGWSGSNSTSRSATVAGSRSRMSRTRSPCGSMTTVPRRALMSWTIMLGEQGGLSRAGRAEHVQVIPGVGDRQGDGVAADCSASPRTLVPRPPVGTATGAGDRLGAGPVQPGDGEVAGQRRPGRPVPGWRRGTRRRGAARRGRRSGWRHPGPVGEPVAAGVDGERGRRARRAMAA